jgi:hypothetical protein
MVPRQDVVRSGRSDPRVLTSALNGVGCSALHLHPPKVTIRLDAMNKTPWPLVRKRTIPTERPTLVGKIVPNFADRGVSHGRRCGSPVVNLSSLDRNRYFCFKQLLIYPHKGRVDPVPDPLLLRKSGSAGNRTQDL